MKKIKNFAKNLFSAKRMKTLAMLLFLWNIGDLCTERSW